MMRGNHITLLLALGCFSPAESALICLRGSYWAGPRCELCPAGTFGSRPGLTTAQCSGPCAPGHFCPPGSTSATEKVCGSTRFFCPRGSAERQRVAEGYYTTAYPFPSPHSTVDQAARQIQCEPGFYCINGIRRACPAGMYGLTSGLMSAECSGLCPPGFYCPEGTSNPLACRPGTFGATAGLSSPACSGVCPIGYYCEQASVAPNPCPPGTFGGTRGLTSKRCSSVCSDATTCLSSLCPAGYYCPVGTTAPIPCGGVAVFCPKGSPVPTLVRTGYYTVWSRTLGSVRLNRLEDGYIVGGELAQRNQTTRVDQQQCERGSYCVAGEKRWCPAGTYGSTAGLSTAQCSGQCPPGYFCPTGTADFYVYPCTQHGHFCRVGSTALTPVSTGYYTITASTGDVRIDQVICPLGSYCVGGVQYLCPPGTSGLTTGLTTPACSGRCQDGFTCPVGSVSPTQIPCPAGTYSRNGVTCAPCSPGYYCTAGSPDPRQNACGSDSVYCPLGSSAPISVATGYFSEGQTETTHTSQALCRIQSVQHLAQCPSRTIGVYSEE